MKRLVIILNYLQERNINISSLHYDESTETTLIFMVFNVTEEKLIEISENKFSFFNETHSDFNEYSIEQIIKFLDNNL